MSFTIFEIGANIGSETSIFAEQGNVYAFEPNIVLLLKRDSQLKRIIGMPMVLKLILNFGENDASLDFDI